MKENCFYQTKIGLYRGDYFLVCYYKYMKNRDIKLSDLTNLKESWYEKYYNLINQYVDEYVDAFSHPGQLNIRYDEIKPNDEWIEMNLKGSSKTGNAQVDSEGNALGNVVPTKTGEKFYKNFEENLFGAEQAEASYKRQSQPVEVAGETKIKGGLKRKGSKTSSIQKADKILNNLGESIENESTKLLNEEMETMKKLIGYGYKK